ncbi:MAG: chemotaxis protein CheA [Gemmatimonadaceae bacterium]|nr:chemotaxis protein CheA [Gemmatimonadaceae bacterium]
MDSARYRELFLTEARDHLVSINQSLIALEQSPPSTVRGGESVNELFRAVHTVKGMSAVMGYDSVAALSHAMESLLARVRAGEQPLEPAHLGLLFDAADALESAIETSSVQADAGPASALDVTSLVDRLQGRSGSASSATPLSTLPTVRRRPPPGSGGVVVSVSLEPGTILPGARAQLVVARARTLGAVLGASPDEVALLADDFDGQLALRVATEADDATIARTIQGAGSVATVAIARDTDRSDACEHAPDAASDPSSTRLAELPPGADRSVLADASERFEAAWGNEVLKAPLQRYVRIDLRRLDHLMSLVGELMIVRGSLAQRASAHADPMLDDVVTEASRLVGALQDGVLGARMVPVWQVFDRFPRVVRDAARTLGKDVEFVVEGREIELDRSLLEQVADPLVHLLRNAVDHGIEPPAARVASGKPPTGRLTLSASRERSAVVIRVADDGRGVDRDRVLRTAQAQGVVDAEREALDDDEILRVISRAGFSTADRVTDLSGRGVGIDAVLSRIRALGGTVELRTGPGTGTSFSLRLPVTLAVIPALMARVGDEAYALPLTHVTETLQLTRGLVRTVRGRDVIVIRGEVLPLLHLRDVVGCARGDAATSHVVLLRVADRTAGLVVDQLLGREEIVVKPFDAVRGAATCFNGATIQGDGSAALILEVSSLL